MAHWLGQCVQSAEGKPAISCWLGSQKTACFLFLSLPVMCAVAEPVIELWKPAIFVILWRCEMWSELCEPVGEGGCGLD